MNCKNVWSREFVMGHDAFTKKWVNDEFLEHIGKLIMEQEKMLLPHVQKVAAEVRLVCELQNEVQDLPTQKKLNKIRDVEQRKKAEEEKRKRRNELRNRIIHIKANNPYYNNTKLEESHTTTTSYIMPCPSECGCRGFISSEYKCGTCDIKVCKKCHMQKTDKHVCKKEDIESAKMIMRDSKPCPKCKTAIFKISGCNQMFCTVCHTAFDWETLKVETGIMHNPHYYEWLASKKNNNPVNIEEVACGEIPDPDLFTRMVIFKDMPRDVTTCMFNMYRNIAHIQNMFREIKVDRVKDNFDLRIQYLLNNFDDMVWATKLKNREKKRMKIKACRDLLDLYVTIISDFVRQMTLAQTVKEMDVVFQQYLNLINYHDDAMERIIRVHGGKIPDSMHPHRLFTAHYSTTRRMFEIQSK